MSQRKLAVGICGTCNGSGLVPDGKGGLKVCPTCKGEGLKK